jgi:hypothetical protein
MGSDTFERWALTGQARQMVLSLVAAAPIIIVCRQAVVSIGCLATDATSKLIVAHLQDHYNREYELYMRMFISYHVWYLSVHFFDQKSQFATFLLSLPTTCVILPSFNQQWHPPKRYHPQCIICIIPLSPLLAVLTPPVTKT